MPAHKVDPLKTAALDAQRAQLQYTGRQKLGISRLRRGNAFEYRLPSGKPLRDARAIKRIRHLAIPPAWSDVWINPSPNGHLQATGRDARGRKQARYHPLWRAARDQNKFERTVQFGKMLPRIRKRVAADLRAPGIGHDKAVAAVIRLLESTLIRIGNEEYRRQNGSVGLSTMRDRHVRIRGGVLHFDFKGKSGVHHVVHLRDPRLAAIVKRMQDLPGEVLFQFIGEDGRRHRITSSDVNTYLHELGGDAFSAKDFRTWAGTVLAAIAMGAPPEIKRRTKRAWNGVVETVAKRLGNTPAVCRKCYIHPIVGESFLAGDTLQALENRAASLLLGEARWLPRDERVVLGFLMKKMKAAKPRAPKSRRTT